MRKFNISNIVSKINNFACLAIFIGIFLPFMDFEKNIGYSSKTKSVTISIIELIWKLIESVFEGKFKFSAMYFVLCIVAFFAALIAGNLFRESLSMKNPIIMIISGVYIRYLLSKFLGNGALEALDRGYSAEIIENYLGIGYDLIVAGVTVIIICGIAGVCVNYYIENIKYKDKDSIKVPNFLKGILEQIKMNSNNDNSNFCKNCGAKISEGNLFCPNCGQEVTANVICPKCNATNEKNSAFCAECGNKLKD